MSEVILAETGFITSRFDAEQALSWTKAYFVHTQRNL